MKKIIAIIFTILLFTNFPISSVAFAQPTDYIVEKYAITNIKEQIIDFVCGESLEDNLRTDRSVGSAGEKLAAEYVEDKFLEYGLTGFFEDEFIKEFSVKSLETKSRNVAGVKLATVQTKKTVIIGAHIDNYRSEGGFLSKASSSDGVYDNASGVVAMLNIANLLKDENFNYNIIFIGFGGEEAYQLGSIEFLNYLLNDLDYAVEDILLMINLDAIGSGDYLYLYSDEVKTLHDTYFRDIANLVWQEFGYNQLKDMPLFKRVSYYSNFSNFTYNHMGLSSDNVTFLNAKINSVNFFSGNWNTFGLGITESDKNENVFHTSNDNLEYLDELYGEEFYKKIETSVNIIVNALKQEGFSSVMVQSFKDKTDYFIFSNSMYLKAGLSIIIITAIIVINYLNKRKPSNNYEELKKAVLENKIEDIEAK